MKAPENISSNQCVQRIISYKLLINSIALIKKEHQLINESPSDCYDCNRALLKIAVINGAASFYSLFAIGPLFG